MTAPRFLPESLRRPPRPPRASRRRWRWSPLAAVVLPLLVVLVWRVDVVEVDLGPQVPEHVVRELRSLEGRMVAGLDLDHVRAAVEVWPGVDWVEVRLELPGVLRVRALPSPIAGSTRIGHRWHGVTRDGTLAGPAAAPVLPVVEAPAMDAETRARLLAVARRVGASCGRPVHSVRAVTPVDLRLELAPKSLHEAPVVLHVAPRPTAAEAWWCARLAAGEATARWADLRSDGRAVVGGAA